MLMLILTIIGYIQNIILLPKVYRFIQSIFLLRHSFFNSKLFELRNNLNKNDIKILNLFIKTKNLVLLGLILIDMKL
jgi:hypothetical protein